MNGLMNIKTEVHMTKGELPEIRVNDAELMPLLKQELKKYQNVKFTEDTYKEGKAVRADLNRLKKAIDAKRLDVKKEWNKPFNDFEAKMKSLIAVVEEPIKAIDQQVKAFENEKSEAKVKFAEEEFAAIKSNFKNLDFVTFDAVYQSDFRNLTKKEADITLDISNTLTRITNELDMIERIDSNFTFEMIDHFKKNFDVSAAISEGQRLHDLKERKEAEEARLEALKKAADRIPVPEQQGEADNDFHSPEPAAASVEVTEEALTLTFKVTGSKKDLYQLAEYMRRNNIHFERA